MDNEKRLIDASAVLETQFTTGLSDACGNYYGCVDVVFASDIENAPTVDAVEVVRIEEVKNEILQTIDEFISEYRHISQSYVDHFGGKADAMETARRLVNAALTDLCSYGERRNNVIFSS